MSKHDIEPLYRYNDWAQRRILAQTARVSTEQYVAPAPVPQGSLRGTLVHSLAAEVAWRHRLHGQGGRAGGVAGRGARGRAGAVGPRSGAVGCGPAGLTCKQAPASPDALTPREEEVLRQLALGRTNRQIAEALIVGEETVKTHIGNIFAKLHLAHRTQAMIYAFKRGLVSVDDLNLE